MGMWSAHASGIIIIIEWGSERPVARRSSRTLSKVAVSLWLVSATMGSSLRDVVAEDIGLQHGMAGGHPVGVAAQGVDLAVVDDVAVGMC